MKKEILDTLSKLFLYKQKSNYKFTLLSNETDDNSNTEANPDSIKDVLDPIKKDIFSSIDDNLNYMKARYSFLINSDIDIREFSVTISSKNYKAFLVYIDGMANVDSINHYILKPLMLKNKVNKKSEELEENFELEKYIYDSLIPENKVVITHDFSDVFSSINRGDCAIFIDSLPISYTIDVKGFKQRSISSPQNEVIVRGSQEAFVEPIRTNTSILRRLINNENLVIESTTVGSVSNTLVAICYMNNIANSDLVAEVQYRINNLKIDYLISSGQLEQLIQDNSENVFPQIIATERPDKAVTSLLDGRVVALVNGSPYALIMPGVLNDFLSSPEDLNLKYQFSSLVKFIRLLSALLALQLPGLYVAITNYHHELIPTELLFAIASSREAVPFPILFEILLMELSFELIREAGLRVPSPIGPTIGIVGALILGDAAVKASIVSPILIIIVAITALCSFSIPDLSLSFTFRILRFGFIFLGYLGGFLGIGLGLFVLLASLSNLSSFGVSYIFPYFSKEKEKTAISYLESPIWKRERKPGFLNPKKIDSQDHISMKWKHPN